MFHQPMGRSQRAKGSKGKNILQVTVLLAVAVWLLYQTKHSYERKSEYADTDYNKLSKGDTDINFGRKFNAGSENRINTDPHEKNSDETAETGEIGIGQDVFDQKTEEKAEEVNESEESREDITNNGKEETLQEQQGNVDNNGDSHTAGEVNTEGSQESLRLPNQRDSDNFDQNDGRNKGGNFVEENGLLKDGATSADGTNSSDGETITSEEASSSTSQTETGESAGQGGETSETGGEHSNDALPVTEEFSRSSASDDQNNNNISDDNDTHQGDMVEAHEGTKSDTETASHNTVEETTTNPTSDAEVESENVNLPNSTENINVVVPVNDEAPKKEVESQVATSQAEIAGKSSVEAATTGTSSEGGNTNFAKPGEENNAVMPDSNGAPGREEGESQTDRISEDQATGNSSIEAVAADTSSEGENANLRHSSEEGLVMSDKDGAPKWEEVQSQTDHMSDSEKADNNSSEEANSDRRSTTEPSEKEMGASQGANSSDAEVTINSTIEEKSDPKSSDEAANSSLTNKNEHVELQEDREGGAVEEVQSQGNNASDAENAGKSSLVEDKSEKSNDLVANSAQNSEQNSSDLQTGEIPNGEVASHEDNALKVESTSTNVESAMAEPQSGDPTSSDLDSNIELSSDSRTGEGQEGSTGPDSI